MPGHPPIQDADGTVTAEGTRTVAADGKRYRLVDANGDLVYDKQLTAAIDSVA